MANSTFSSVMAKKAWPKGVRDECRVTHALSQRLLFFLIIVFAPCSFSKWLLPLSALLPEPSDWVAVALAATIHPRRLPRA